MGRRSRPRSGARPKRKKYAIKKRKREIAQRKEQNKGIPGARRMCTRKVRYPTAEAAAMGASYCMNNGSPDLAVYRCPLCGGWHLTHRYHKM